MNQTCVNCQHYSEDEFGLGVCHRLTVNTENGFPMLKTQDGSQEPVVLGTPIDFGCSLWEKK